MASDLDGHPMASSSDQNSSAAAPPEVEEPPRVKLLCSFGGCILPRPLDGRLRYVGGETRIVSLPRDVRYDELILRMRELFEGAWVLKYQQPDEDLDALVSVVNDDDVTNMMEEHDKLGINSDGFVRLRVFLFSQPEHSGSAIASQFEDERETERRYVDALNCVVDGNPQSPDLDAARLHQFGGLNRLAIPRRPSHGQLYADVDGPWSPAAYYSPGQLTPRDHHEFSPSPRRFHEYEREMSPFVDGGNVVWVPQGGAVAEMAGFPGNLGHNHGNVYEGSGGCEQCRMALQRGQDARYYDARSRHYGQFHLEQSGMGGEISGTPFINSCSECIRQRETYLMNQEMTFEREQFDRHTFYNDFHVHDRSWVAHPHLFGHHPEEMRAGRNEQQYVMDGNAMNFASAHGGMYNGNSVSSNYAGYPDSRYGYVGNEQGNEMYPDPHGTLPPLRIPRQEESGMRYNIVAPSYGTAGLCQVSDGSSSVHGSRRNAYGPVGTGPAYEPPPSLMTQTNGANMAYPRDTLEESTGFSHVRAADHFQNHWTGQNGIIPHAIFPTEAITVPVPDYALNLKPEIPNQESSLSATQEPMQLQAAGGNLGINGETGPLASLSACWIDDKTMASTALAKIQFPEAVAGHTATMVGATVVNNLPGEVIGKEQQQDTAMELEARNSSYLEKMISASGQIVGHKEKHLIVDDCSTSNSPAFVGHANASHPDENEEYAMERLGILPELIASVKQIALEGAEDVKAKAQEGPVAEASSHQCGDTISQHENPEQIDGCKDADVDSDGEQAVDSNIEPTTAEKEALAKGLQAIQNDDLEEIRELGSGAYGSVFHGKWKGTDVAIKRIKASCFSGKPSERERLISDFWKEALILSSLHHPNVVAFYGVVRDGPDGTLATVTEFMVNGSLKQFLQKKDRTIDRRKRLIIAMDAAFGMEYLHGKNIVHFDLKCENLLVNMRDPHRPVCKIGDLGLSKVKQRTLVSGGIRGTLPWMAPELLSGKSKMVTEKVDVYSFGVVMWELLTGEDPYADMHCASIIGGIVNSTLRPQIPSWCDPEWKSLMESCWSSDPSVRPSFLEISQKLRKMAAAMNLK